MVMTIIVTMILIMIDDHDPFGIACTKTHQVNIFYQSLPDCCQESLAIYVVYDVFVMFLPKNTPAGDGANPLHSNGHFLDGRHGRDARVFIYDLKSNNLRNKYELFHSLKMTAPRHDLVKG